MGEEAMIAAMEFTEIPVSRVEEFIDDETYYFEQKMDGTRVLIALSSVGDHRYYTRKGEPLKHSAALLALPGLQADLDKITAQPRELGFAAVTLDGELIPETGAYHIFDLPMGKHYTYGMRREILGRIVPFGLANVKTVRTYSTTVEKRELWNRIQDERVEGMMVKPADSRYEAGIRSKECFKVKLASTADVVVMSVDRPDPKHGSIEFGVYRPDEEGKPTLVSVGRCSAIGKPPVSEGDVIEVRYLYWTETTTYQPRMVRVRDDKEAVDCTLDQFLPYSRKAV